MLIKDLYKYYESLDPEFEKILARKFPRFYRETLDIEVRPWNEYAESLERFDVNPEAFDGKVPPTTYARKVMGVAFIKERKVAFREIPPTQTLFIHELGHIQFKVDEIPWNSAYGGAETLFWLIWHGKVEVDDPDTALAAYVEAMKVAHEGNESAKKDLLDALVREICKTLGIEPPCLANIYRRMGVLSQESFLNFDFHAYYKAPEMLIPDMKVEPFRLLSDLMESAKFEDNGAILLPVAIEVCESFFV